MLLALEFICLYVFGLNEYIYIYIYIDSYTACGINDLELNGWLVETETQNFFIGQPRREKGRILLKVFGILMVFGFRMRGM